ncbi:MAG: DUF5343 domain-containing protein [Cellvibrio sp.]|uniref:DUF5343 domain-containing protein n=1 Tax=Cellvibrio sp. TaxID=1965322 RepID=UPI0031AF2904
MANGDAGFPKISDSSWWKLRNLFKQKVPTVLTPSYLASALSMGEDSAKSNVISPFKKIGIIGEDGKPTDLAYEWRDDHKYAAVCSSLIDKLYPQELKDLFHTPDADPQKLTNWFMNSARCGEPAAKHFSRFYLLLLKADLTEADASLKKSLHQNLPPLKVKLLQLRNLIKKKLKQPDQHPLKMVQRKLKLNITKDRLKQYSVVVQSCILIFSFTYPLNHLQIRLIKFLKVWQNI